MSIEEIQISLHSSAFSTSPYLLFNTILPIQLQTDIQLSKKKVIEAQK